METLVLSLDVFPYSPLCEKMDIYMYVRKQNVMYTPQAVNDILHLLRQYIRSDNNM